MFRHKRSRRLGKWLRIFLLILFFLLVLELGWLVVANFPQRTVIVETGTITKGCWVEAVYLRNETLLQAPADGYLTIRIPSGTKIPCGEVVGWISQEPTEDLPEDALRLAKKVALYQSENDGLELELQRLNSEIFRRQAMSNKGAARADLALLEKERQRIVQSIRNCRDEANKALVKLDYMTGGIVIISSTSAGIFYREYDGLEEQLNPESIRQLPVDIFKKKFPLKTPPSQISKGEPVGKLVEPFTEVLVAKVDPRVVGTPCLGDEWEVKTTNGWRNIKIIDIISLTNDKMMVGFYNNHPEIRFMPDRRQKLFMVYRRVKGSSIPVQAIFRKKDKTWVRIVKGDEFKEQEIRVVETDGNRAIVTGLEFGTAILSR